MNQGRYILFLQCHRGKEHEDKVVEVTVEEFSAFTPLRVGYAINTTGLTNELSHLLWNNIAQRPPLKLIMEGLHAGNCHHVFVV